MAEASFLRGLYYFDLVRAFGGVPKVTSTTPPTKVPRSTADEIYDLIISDLKFAARESSGEERLRSG
ncbi:MAG: RagB/SusD family nutrient uptake outer membrane protein [Marinilabiliales bacterium]|nr:RagB/SusD family nutrient uptake outer membrane protein [Marinilabiliales bacterium]